MSPRAGEAVVFDVDGHSVKLSNASKVLFPRDGFTKKDLADYYLAVAPAILEHLRGRPAMMQRAPEGIDGQVWYQKETPAYFPAWISRTTVKKRGGTNTLVVVDNAATLAYLADQASITLHTWLSRADQINCPDQMIFDLDPPQGRFALARAAARKVHDLLDELSLPAYLKTTGGKGLHVLVPLDRSEDFDDVRSFAESVAEVLAARDPAHLTTEFSKSNRRGRLFLDVARNAYAQTAVAAYAVRIADGAPVSTPIEWGELSRVKPSSFTIRSVPKRLARKKDPWRSLSRQATSLRKARRRLESLA
jgi:bifunctional non-homologous end joining protein LigD